MSISTPAPGIAIDLSGRTALVTGSTAGIGHEIAAQLARAGATVVVNGRTVEGVREAIELLTALVPGGAFRAAPGSVGTADGVAEVIAAAGDDVDVLVNNAAVYAPKPLPDIDDELWQEFFDVNVMSAVRLSRHYAPLMAQRRWGRIVMIGSEAAVQVRASMVHYGVTKIALQTLARGIATSYPGSGLTVNTVLPGPTRSRGVTDFLAGEARRLDTTLEDVEERWMKRWNPTSLTRRVTEAAEVANLVTFLCSPLSSATTGAALRADGGSVNFVA